MKKSGAAPVIIILSSLALLVFALILIFVVFPYFEESIATSASESITCSPMLYGFDVRHACSVANELQLLLENNKQQDIESFNVKVYGDRDVYESVTDKGITGFAVQKVYSSYDMEQIGKINKVAIYPILKSGGQVAQCSNMALEVKDLMECTAGCVTCKTQVGICDAAQQDDICEGLDILYGIGCRKACCFEYGLCCVEGGD